MADLTISRPENLTTLWTPWGPQVTASPARKIAAVRSKLKAIGGKKAAKTKAIAALPAGRLGRD